MSNDGNFHGKYVIFSIDGCDDPLICNQFLNRVTHHPERVNNIIPLIGMYSGVRERSFMMEREDFLNCVPVTYYYNQESILWVTECNKQYATLEYSDGTAEGIGCIRCVSEAEALAADGWTYRPDLDKFYIAVDGNPDRVYA